MLKYFFIVILGLLSLHGITQNYIPNYSFEDTTSRVTPLYLPEHWTAATQEGWNYFTPFNNLSAQYLDYSAPSNFPGYQHANSGLSYTGILIYDLDSRIRSNIREYLQVKLKNPLTVNNTYCFQLYISLADSMHFASKNMLGVYFSQNAVSANHRKNLPYTPQLVVSPNTYITDKVNWVKIDMQYQAQGGEEYVTIGNFNDTNYIDTAFVPGGGDQFWMQASYYYIDDIWLSHCDSIPDSLTSIHNRSLKSNLKVYPNPFHHQFSIQTSSQEQLYFALFNALGQEISLKVSRQKGEYQIQPAQIPPGLYWLKVSDGKTEEVIKVMKRK